MSTFNWKLYDYGKTDAKLLVHLTASFKRMEEKAAKPDQITTHVLDENLKQEEEWSYSMCLPKTKKTDIATALKLVLDYLGLELSETTINGKRTVYLVGTGE